MSAVIHKHPEPESAPAVAATHQYLTFQVGGALFALPILAVQEIRSWEDVSRIPRTDTEILGVVNLRGAVVPVLDVRTRLGMDASDVTPTTVMIVVRIDGRDGAGSVVGCVVDAVSDVTSISVAEIRPAPEACGSIDRHLVEGVASIGNRLVLLLDVRRLISG